MDRDTLVQLTGPSLSDHPVVRERLAKLREYVKSAPTDDIRLQTLAGFGESQDKAIEKYLKLGGPSITIRVSAEEILDRAIWHAHQVSCEGSDSSPVSTSAGSTPWWAYVVLNPVVLAIGFPIVSLLALAAISQAGADLPAPISSVLLFLYDLVFGCHPSAPLC